VLGEKDALQSFTAIGTVREGEPYRSDMGCYESSRRDVTWAEAREASIRPLLDELAFTKGRTNWGYQLRFGLFAIEQSDFQLIAKAMQAAI
jgi:hypothetical protein